MPFQTYGPEAVAVVAATARLAASLAKQGELGAFHLVVDSSSYQEIFSQGGAAIKPLAGLWWAVLRALRDVLQVRGGAGLCGGE